MRQLSPAGLSTMRCKNRFNGTTSSISGHGMTEPSRMISAQVVLTAQFGELDPMHVVWHGNYVRYMEQARAALMDKIDYNFPGLDASGYLWPIVDMRLKYIKPIRFRQTVQVEATLVEYEN